MLLRLVAALFETGFILEQTVERASLFEMLENFLLHGTEKAIIKVAYFIHRKYENTIIMFKRLLPFDFLLEHIDSKSFSFYFYFIAMFVQHNPDEYISYQLDITNAVMHYCTNLSEKYEYTLFIDSLSIIVNAYNIANSIPPDYFISFLHASITDVDPLSVEQSSSLILKVIENYEDDSNSLSINSLVSCFDIDLIQEVLETFVFMPSTLQSFHKLAIYYIEHDDGINDDEAEINSFIEFLMKMFLDESCLAKNIVLDLIISCIEQTCIHTMDYINCDFLVMLVEILDSNNNMLNSAIHALYLIITNSEENESIIELIKNETSVDLSDIEGLSDSLQQELDYLSSLMNVE